MDQAIAGARCAVHPDRLAQGTCRRCGNFACSDCTAAGFDAGTLCVTCAQAAPARYHVVPVWRFVLFGALTLGIYELYWFWKMWSQIKRADGSDIWPIPRAIFAGITYFGLLSDINTQLAVRGIHRELSSALAVGFFVSGALYRLPQPYALLSTLTVLFAVPAVKAAYELAGEAARAEGSRWRVRHTVLLVLSVPFFLSGLVGSFLPDPTP